MANARFTRLPNTQQWVLATLTSDDAHRSIMAERKGGDVKVMVTGGYVGTKIIDNQTWHLYEIDRKRGGKAPTSGRLGENPGGSTGELVPSKEDFDATGDIRDSMGDLSEYAKIADMVHADAELAISIGEVKSSIIALGDKVTRQQRVTIQMADVSRGTLKELEGHHHAALPDVLDCLACGVHVYVVGPAGSGKTHLATSAASALDRELFICGAMLTKHEVIGYQTATGEYVTTAARKAFEHGGILLWDEVDASMPAALVAVNAMLANDQYTFPDRTVTRHADFVCMAAGNTYGTGADREYVGRMQLDAATLDRFAIIDVDYDLGLERAIACAEFKAHGGTEERTICDWIDLVVLARGKVRANGIRHVISPRASIHGARLLARGTMPLNRVIEIVLRKGLDDDAANQIGVA